MMRRRLVRLLAVCGVVVAFVTPIRGARLQPAAAAAGAVSDQRIGVLPIFYPSERDFAGSTRPMWNRLAAAGDDVGLVVITQQLVASIDYKDFVEREQGAGQTVLGTLTAQSESTMLANASTMRSLFGINGVLLQNYSGQCTFDPKPSESLIASLRALGLSTIAVETLATPEACYASLADVLLTFNANVGSYGSGPVRPAWLTGATPKLWHAIYGVTNGQIAATVATSKAAGADYVFTTPDAYPSSSPTAIPDSTYWEALRIAVRGVGKTSTASEVFPAVTRQTLGIPVFGTAQPSSWPTIATASAAEFAYVVVNAESGPGASSDAGLLSRISAAKAAGRKVLGYVALGYTPTGVASRSDAAIFADVTKWRDFYGVTGIFLDEVQPECAVAGYGDIGVRYAAIAAGIRSIIPGAFVALNPGRNIGECFAASFDAIVAFEGSASAYTSWTPSRWQDRWPTTLFWHLVYSAPSTDLGSLVTLSKCRNADAVHVTSQVGGTLWVDPIDPTYFGNERAAVNGTTRCGVPSAAPVAMAPRSTAGAAPPAAEGTRGPASPAATIATDLIIDLSAVPNSAVPNSSAVSGDAPTHSTEPPLLHAHIPTNLSAVSVAGPLPRRVPVRLSRPVTSVSA